jgi:hypothetical protein
MRPESQLSRISFLCPWLWVVLLFCPAVLHAEAPAPSLSVSSDVARAGYYQLLWALDEADVAHYRVEEAADPQFRSAELLYEGADRATVISGRGDGTFHYRVQAMLADGARSPWSEASTVRVEHHPFNQAVFLFLLGAVVFIATIGLIVAGTLKEWREADRA